MKNKYLKFFLPIAMSMALVLSLMGTRSVLADDDAPPTPTEETPTDNPPIEPVSTEEPVDTLQVEPSSTEEPVVIPNNMDETIPEILEQIPAETDLIVLNEDGEPLPLVSNEAADVLITGDPMWCPDGVTPGTDALNECTIAHPSFTDLINDLETNSATYFGSGTIYVSYDYDATIAGDAGSDIIFDYGTASLTDLIVQGGWDFTQDKVVGTSTIDLGLGSSLEFRDWGGYGVPGSLTLNDLIITNSDGLYIGDVYDYTTADVTLDNVDVTDTDWGTYIGTEGDAEITDSRFTDTQFDSGLIVYSLGDITVSDIYVAGNLGDGAVLDNCGCVTSNIFISSSTFELNGGAGLAAYSAGNITINDIVVDSNDFGAFMYADGNINLYCSKFTNNSTVGLYGDVPSGSTLTLNGVTISGNGFDFVPPAFGGTWAENSFNCATGSSGEKGKSTTTTGLPLNIVNVANGNSVGLDCEQFSGTKLVLENGDNLVVPCPLGGSASLTRQGADGLPASLPSGSVFKSSFVAEVSENGQTIDKLSQSVLVSFVIPEGVDASELVILYWDGAQWLEVDGTFTLNENGISYFAAYVNYTGAFVLVQN
ncbi:MAG: right-handed parallel beta-helix repeat-containing protein [Chloroflexi bacterium]|nr:right-handed parallel beta-helix repeat-containing protein [Chloroflexota bacterium]